MDMFFTRQRWLKQALLLVPLLGAMTAQAQTTNIAPAATVKHHDDKGPTGGVGIYGAHNYNDGFVGDYPGDFYGWVNTNGFIEWEWPVPQTFNRVVAYMGTRPFRNAKLESWDGTSWQPIIDFRSTATEEDSITFQPVTTTKLRMSRIAGAVKGTPSDFREIMIRQAPNRNCGGGARVSDVWPAKQERCFGDEALLVAGNYNYDALFQWQVNPGSGWTDIPGATQTWYRFRVTKNTPSKAEYRLSISCDGRTFDYSPPVEVLAKGGNDAVYAKLPYFEGFEKTPWLDFCEKGDVPSESWTTNNSGGPYKWVSHETRAGNGDFPNPIEGKNAARFASVFQGDNPPTEGNLDLHIDCSVQPGGQRVEFYYANMPFAQPNPGNDFILVMLSTDGGQNFIPIGAWEEEAKWSKKVITFESGSANTIIRFKGHTQRIPGQREFTDLGIDSVFVRGVDPCSGNPSVPTVTAAANLLCAGTATTLSGSNVDRLPGIQLQWQQANAAGGPWTNVVGGNGANSIDFETPILYDTIWYRLQVNCLTPGKTGSSASAAVSVQTPSPVYASLPYVESFEEWTKRCDTLNDVPSLSWVATPYQGTNSWRREDEGNAVWGFDTKWDPSTGTNVFANYKASYGMYPDSAFHGKHSARFHTFSSRNKKGALDLFIDCSTHPGDKELSFALNLTRDIPPHPNNNNPPPTDYDYLIVYLSTDNGASFTQLDRFDGPAFSQWETKSIMIPSNSPTTVIRFEATSVTGYRDMGLDYVRVMPACDGRPTAGVIQDVSPCADKDFFLNLHGVSNSGGLVYQWQRSVNGTTWINMPGTGSGTYKAQINAPTYFRVIVSCPASGLADTTPVKKIELAPFYHCYCESGFDPTRPLNATMDLIHCGKNIGNVTIVDAAGDTILNNGNYTPWFSHPEPVFRGYTDYRNSAKITALYQDGDYEFTIHSIYTSNVGSNPVKWAAYIDYNRDGVYDTINERIWIHTNKNTDTRSGGVPYHTYSFKVPANAEVGITGMRVVMMGGTCTMIPDWNEGPTPCIRFGDGETEDYLVEIKYPECSGAPAAGTTTVSHERHCPGYTVTLTNSNHESQKSSIGWDWQSSPDGNSWSVIANSAGLDTVSYLLTGDVQFRLRIWCSNTEDTSYSNVATVTMKEPYKCYCYSEATGGNLDTSDLGVVTINGKTFGAPGGHLNNAAAVNGRTDNTDSTITIDVTAPLDVALTHILRSAKHADAKITVFIDYDNNLSYDVPDELVLTATSTATGWNISQSITIPAGVVLDKPTGMRVILNNDTDPNVPSDEACGPYVSGETEDYVVILTGNDVSVKSVSHGINQVVLYPNPATDKVYLQYFGQGQEKATVSVLSITGQTLQSIDLNNVTNQSVIELNLDGYANGVYYVRFATPNGFVNEKLTLLGR